MSAIDRIRGLFPSKDKAAFGDIHGNAAEYAPLNGGPLPLPLENESLHEGEVEEDNNNIYNDDDDDAPFSWLEYSIFALIGVAMLWAWNMFMAAAPYFQKRFASDPWILANFQSAVTSVSTCTNLAAMLVLTNIQYTASYPFRINAALLMNLAIFSLLTASTSLFLGVSPAVYLVFLLVMVSGSAWACGLIQNGAFAYAASFGRPEYTQALMAGQGVAGVLPPIAQMVTVLAFPPSSDSPGPDSPGANTVAPPSSPAGREALAAAGTSAFYYFLTAVLISVCSLVAFQPLMHRHNRLVESRMVEALSESLASIEDAERAARKVVGMKTMFSKLHWIASAVFCCFLVSMFFPVLTPKILSVNTGSDHRIFEPSAFIPLAFFFWNLGDFLGRSSTIFPVASSLRERPVLLFAFGVCRLVFLPLYFLCNVGGRGAVVSSDVFYLVVVQLLFGLSSGWLSSTTMMTAGHWVQESEREAAGGFMGLCLVAGLTVGSLLSFTVAGV